MQWENESIMASVIPDNFRFDEGTTNDLMRRMNEAIEAIERLKYVSRVNTEDLYLWVSANRSVRRSACQRGGPMTDGIGTFGGLRKSGPPFFVIDEQGLMFADAGEDCARRN